MTADFFVFWSLWLENEKRIMEWTRHHFQKKNGRLVVSIFVKISDDLKCIKNRTHMGKIYLTKSIMTFDYRSERKCVSQKITNKLFNSHQMRRKYNSFYNTWRMVSASISTHSPFCAMKICPTPKNAPRIFLAFVVGFSRVFKRKKTRFVWIWTRCSIFAAHCGTSCS